MQAAGHDALQVAVAFGDEALGDGLAGDGADEAVAADDGEDVLPLWTVRSSAPWRVSELESRVYSVSMTSRTRMVSASVVETVWALESWAPSIMKPPRMIDPGDHEDEAGDDDGEGDAGSKTEGGEVQHAGDAGLGASGARGCGFASAAGSGREAAAGMTGIGRRLTMPRMICIQTRLRRMWLVEIQGCARRGTCGSSA